MLREATFFLDKLKSEEHHLRDMERSACATLAESARVMDSPLPRLVFESGEQRTVETIGGVEFQGQTVERVSGFLAGQLAGCRVVCFAWLGGFAAVCGMLAWIYLR